MSTNETDEYLSQQRLGRAVAYSARVQEAMRYNRLHSSDYPLVMGVMRDISQGYTEKQWKEEQQRRIAARASKSGDIEASTDTSKPYEQLVERLKVLELWPW